MPNPWQLDIQTKNGASTAASDVPYHSLRAMETLEGPGSIEIELAEPHMASYWEAGTHRAVLTGPLDWAGYLTGLEQSGRPVTGGINWTSRGVGLGSVLDWRIVRHQVAYLDTPISEVVFGLLDEAESQYNGEMSFTPGTVHGAPDSNITEKYCFGVIIGDSIRDLSVQYDFDWEINANGELVIWLNGGRGTDTGLTLEQDGVSDITINYDTVSNVTTVSAVGNSADPYGPVHDMVRDVNAADKFGRREVVIDVNADEDTRFRLINQARAELKARRGAMVTFHATWVNGHGPWGFPAVDLGDRIDFDLPPWFGGNTQTFRCVDRTVELDPAAPDNYFLEYGFQTRITEDELDETDPDFP